MREVHMRELKELEQEFEARRKKHSEQMEAI